MILQTGKSFSKQKGRLKRQMDIQVRLKLPLPQELRA